jgi:VPDSG-CTERM motif
MKIKTYPTVSLLSALFIALATSAKAITIVQSAWQEITLDGGAVQTIGHMFASGGVGSGGVPLVRNPHFILDQTQSPSHPTPSFYVSVSAQQSAYFDGAEFQFSGTVNTEQRGQPDINLLTPPGSIFTQIKAYHYIDVEVTGQSEFFTFNLTTIELANPEGHPTPNQPGLYFGVIDRTTNGYLSQTPLDSRQSFQGGLAPGSYRLEAGVTIHDAIQASQRSVTFADTISFTNLEIAPGAFQTHPLTDPGNAFTDVPAGSWFDPPTTSEFEFQMTDSALFTQIMSLPTGFGAPFEVLAENTSLGFFGTDTSVNFLELLGHGVSAFTVRGITPGVDPASLTAFPIQLDFDTETASFTMTPVVTSGNGGGASVPDSGSTIMLLGMAFGVIGGIRSRLKI